MYINTSFPRVQGDNAKLEKSGLSFSTKKRLSLNYHMYGGSMGTLKVLVGGKTVFTTSGDQGNKWHKSSVEIFDPKASTVRKGTAIVEQPRSIKDGLELSRNTISIAYIYVDRRSEVQWLPRRAFVRTLGLPECVRL